MRSDPLFLVVVDTKNVVSNVRTFLYDNVTKIYIFKSHLILICDGRTVIS